MPHWGSQALKPNYMLNFNSFSITTPILDLRFYDKYEYLPEGCIHLLLRSTSRGFRTDLEHFLTTRPILVVSLNRARKDILNAFSFKLSKFYFQRFL